MTEGGVRRALIAMSGGVDSSVAAACMLRAGYSCVGMTMKLYDDDVVYTEDTGAADGQDRSLFDNAGEFGRTCCSLADTEDAKRVCDLLGIDHYTGNFKDAFRTCVIDKFLDSYKRGLTPNPCIDCNRYMKFDRLLARAGELDCDVIVTGHYARIVYNESTDEYELHKGIDPRKDQSYVLYMLTHAQLSRIRFPIGEMNKDETRKLAEEYGFVNSKKPDSQDICFIPDGDTRGFLKKEGVLCKPGNFVTQSGEVIGTHTGICNYTIGQRKGLNLPDTHPWYVKEIRPKSNEIVLSDNDSLFSKELTASDVCWTFKTGAPEADSFRCRARIRYHHKEADATVYIIHNDKIRIVFDEPQRAITPGQAVVLYDGDRVLGGGCIAPFH